MIRPLTEIVDDETIPSWRKAEECLKALSDLPQNDIARPDYRCAAQVFASFVVADQIGEIRRGDLL